MPTEACAAPALLASIYYTDSAVAFERKNGEMDERRREESTDCTDCTDEGQGKGSWFMGFVRFSSSSRLVHLYYYPENLAFSAQETDEVDQVDSMRLQSQAASLEPKAQSPKPSLVAALAALCNLFGWRRRGGGGLPRTG